MTTLMHACGVAVSVLILSICYTAVAWADPAAQASSSRSTPATITVQVPATPSGMTTTITVQVSGDTAGHGTQVEVTTDATAATQPFISAAIGGRAVTSVSVDAQHPFTWDDASVPGAQGCGPHPPAGTPGCPQHGSAPGPAQPTPSFTAPSGPARPEVAGQQATAPTVAPASPTSSASPASSLSVQAPPSPTVRTDRIPPPLTYTVQPGDTLVEIAARFYGDDSHAFTQIAEANTGQVMNDGRTFSDPNLIQPGWMLVIPEPTYAIADQDGARLYTVQPGDSLTGIATRLLGDAQRWPEVEAIDQRAAQTLAANPGLIWPGMQLRLPPSLTGASPSAAIVGNAGGELQS